MPARPDAVMIFAAGLGTRMRPLTRDRPKALVEVAGRALIDHALALARRAGARRIVVNTHYRGDMLAAHLAGQGDVTLSPEATLLDTGGGLAAALPRLGPGPVLTLNADAVFTGANPLSALADAWAPGRMEALLMLVPCARARAHAGGGDFALDGAGRLVRGGALIHTGAGVIDPARLARWPATAFSLNPVWDAMIADGAAFGMVHPGGWCDVGHPDAIAEAEAMLAGGGDA